MSVYFHIILLYRLYKLARFQTKLFLTIIKCYNKLCFHSRVRRVGAIHFNAALDACVMVFSTSRNRPAVTRQSL